MNFLTFFVLRFLLGISVTLFASSYLSALLLVYLAQGPVNILIQCLQKVSNGVYKTSATNILLKHAKVGA